MAIDVLITTDRISRDPLAREFIEYVRGNTQLLRMDGGVVYYDFPTYADYETVAHKPDVLLVSKSFGVMAVRFFDPSILPLSQTQVSDADESLGQFCSILIGRLLKSRPLRKGLSSLSFNVTPVVYAPGAVATDLPLEYAESAISLQSFSALAEQLTSAAIGDAEFAEIRSVIEGAKALTRPQKRMIADPAVQRQALQLATLEAEIANFDQKQRSAALVSVQGPQRIRGLAGSGKTVILAMKAAHLHLTRPDEQILVTFFTRSLRAPIKNMITRFFRHYRDEDPDWDRVHIRHGWGGASTPGVYADASRREGRSPTPFGRAQSLAGRLEPFDYVCRELVAHGVKPYYDHVLIDEGQDFPGGFYELCFHLAKGSRDKKNIVWAYDELQNILDVSIRSPEQLFGLDTDGEARISLERSARQLPAGIQNDTVLSKCYRNQREVLVTAHALGFGIYRNIVQLLESKEHWEDVGYEVISNTEFKVGKKTQIVRPAANNPLSLAGQTPTEIISIHVATDLDAEIAWVIAGVQAFLAGGLQPEDIILIALDDRNARTYFKYLSEKLSEQGVSTNNILADPYNEPPFSISGKITLSTVYRAKGNEAAVVFALGVDGVRTDRRSGRNKLFTAFTRTKAWLRISGVGATAANIKSEVDQAIGHFPSLDFVMPDLGKVELIQRDLSRRSIKAKKIRDEFIKRMKAEGFSEDEIAELLSMDPDDE